MLPFLTALGDVERGAVVSVVPRCKSGLGTTDTHPRQLVPTRRVLSLQTEDAVDEYVLTSILCVFFADIWIHSRSGKSRCSSTPGLRLACQIAIYLLLCILLVELEVHR